MRNAVAAIGLLSWDRFIVTDGYPGPGEYAIVHERFEQAGGTTGNTCAALARLGIDVMLVSRVGDDPEGIALKGSLHAAGVDTRFVEAARDQSSDSGIIVISGTDGQRDRTIFWIQGAKPEAGMTLPVDEMLACQWVMLDITDVRLRAFFLDLPAHRSPRTRIFGTMTYLVEMAPDEGWQHVLRHDVVAGNAREFMTLTKTSSLPAAIEIAQRDLRTSACRVLFISRGAQGGIAIRPSGMVESPAIEIDVLDTTGAGDAFAAGCLWGMLDHLDDENTLRRANVLGGTACRALGARAGLPTRDEVERFLSQ
jgi:sugar/nucleoside kinase (ribokinase family)